MSAPSRSVATCDESGTNHDENNEAVETMPVDSFFKQLEESCGNVLYRSITCRSQRTARKFPRAR